MEMASVPKPAFASPHKALPKAPKLEAVNIDIKQPDNSSKEMKNNNKAMANIEVANESDDDDSVFINENKPKKASKTSAKSKGDAVPATADVSSVMLSGASASSSNAKTAAAQNPNSRDSNVKSETVVR